MGQCYAWVMIWLIDRFAALLALVFGTLLAIPHGIGAQYDGLCVE